MESYLRYIDIPKKKAKCRAVCIRCFHLYEKREKYNTLTYNVCLYVYRISNERYVRNGYIVAHGEMY